MLGFRLTSMLGSNYFFLHQSFSRKEHFMNDLNGLPNFLIFYVKTLFIDLSRTSISSFFI